jgi:undecaprenyl-diphosphatase
VLSGVQVALSLWEACLLGVVQGLTEFLPVSSDGHLAVVQFLLTPMPAQEKLAVDVALHLGTLVALLVYFRRELVEMAAAVVGRRGPDHRRTWFWLIGLGTLPAVIAGLTLEHAIAETLDSLMIIGLGFLATGSVLFYAGGLHHAVRTEETLGVRDAIVIGLFQATALLPGVSRSGTTISAGLLTGLRPDVAATFSFLLAIPAVSGALALEAKTIVGLGPSMGAPLVAGVVVAGVTGLAAIAILMRVVRGGKLRYFAYYCWALGVVVLAAAMRSGRT